ncbi:MAG: hypothetical protein QGI34_00155 [Candidatus Latescibacteria bacterium]|nr:hypothetical protein [Candidatus Latescibacterota bacterium]
MPATPRTSWRIELKLKGTTFRILRTGPGTSYGYRIEREGKTMVFSSDSEQKSDACDEGYPLVDFFQDADLAMFDAQYTVTESIYAKED